jgi:hypothetical protein
MTDFWIFFKFGLEHVLDLNGYDHLLFLVVLTVPYTGKDWKRILLLVSLFTLGHTLSLFLAVLNIVRVQPTLIEFLIPITILLTALYNLATAGKSKSKENLTFIGGITLFFGLIHGLGFSNYFKDLLPGEAPDKMLPMLAFALGIEAAQLIIVLVVLLLSFVFLTLFRFSKREFILVFSAIVLGIILPLLAQNPIWEP